MVADWNSRRMKRAEQRVNDALIAVEEALDVPAPAPAPAEPSAAVLEEIAKLREALAASQSARNAEIQEAVSDRPDRCA